MRNEPAFPRMPGRIRGCVLDVVERVSTIRYGVYGLALLRIGYGLILLGLLLLNYGDRRLLWGPESPLSSGPLRESLAKDRTFSLFALSDSGVQFEVLYHAFIVLAALFLVGWRTRWVTPLLAIMVWSWRHRQPWVLDGGDDVMQLVLIYLSFADLSARWSLDAKRAARLSASPDPGTGGLRRRVATVLHNTALLATLIQVCLMYMNTGLLKVQGGAWQEGTALYYALRIEEVQPFPGLSRLIYDNALLVTLGTYAAVFVQLTFPLLMLNSVARRVGLVAVMGMHAGIGLLMGLLSFSLIMMSTDLLFIRGSSIERAAQLVRTVLAQRVRTVLAPVLRMSR
ncbi:hypothetical protein Misp01_52500 [Microtetraspora sp. NBRC 13810]|uniref:HTTM domain-containing protein n=1 Tax=Microtetraspora sp. NBRC 13810 TaxID=3030990 RepID=UPI002554B618|nr:HTTM domain-containing protein [Microtetraspora sp. NBRC 13810]GLW10121.1 hypothetical protein Misp01_52500 [Microtetraspora sp. NBRC 13810]